MPYEWNWSQDVEKCTLDLVLSSSTRANTIQTTVLASKECQKFPPEPLVLHKPARRMNIQIMPMTYT